MSRLPGAIVVAVALLAGCASAAPVTQVDQNAAEYVDLDAEVDRFLVLMQELSDHFQVAQPGEGADSIISAGATVDVAVAELGQGLDLGEQARGFAAATAFELTERAQASRVESVEFLPAQAAVVGSVDGHTLVSLQLQQLTVERRSPLLEEVVTYSLALSDGRLAGIYGYAEQSGVPVIDSGVGLDSPTGAAARFADLALEGDWAAIAYLSGDANTDVTTLQVLRSALIATQAYSFVALPQFQLGNAHVVYVLDEDERVVGRFDVVLDEQTTVVYAPTA